MNITSVLPLRRVGAIVLLTGVLVACDRSINVDEVIDRAAVLYESGAHRASVIELKNAVREDPANARARQLLGENYIELGDANSAEKELRRALDLGVDAAVLAVPLARVMLLQGRYEDALDAAEAAAAPAGSARAAVLVVRGRAYGSLADLDAAEAAFRAARIGAVSTPMSAWPGRRCSRPISPTPPLSLKTRCSWRPMVHP